MKLIGRLLDVLSETVEAWDVFQSDVGDKRYFRIIRSTPYSQTRAHQSLQNIKDTFESLKQLQRKLVSQSSICEASAKAVG
jgi:hypothetical protein